MTGMEFLQELKKALEAETDAYTVQDNLNYYDQYIKEEIRKGRSEEAVMEELGDPWLIARTIIDSPERTAGQGAYTRYDGGTTYEYREDETGNTYQKDLYHSYGRPSGLHILSLDTWWKKLLVILGVAGVIFFVVSLITGIISLAAPLLVPLLVVIVVVRLLSRHRR